LPRIVIAVFRSAEHLWRLGSYNPDVWRNLASRRDWQIALAMTVVLRFFYSALAAALSFILHPDPSILHSNALTEQLSPDGGLHGALIGIWQRFDALWYVHIAHYGYDRPMAVIFYPLYPMAIRIVSWALSPAVAALAISTVGAFFCFWGWQRLGSESLSASGKTRMLWLISTWPGSFVLFAGYAESLTVALIVWSIVFAREDSWWRAALCGFLAGLARPSGVLVAIPLFVMAMRSRRWVSMSVLLAPLGTLGYWGWLWWSGRPSVPQAYGMYQGTPFVPPWQGLWLALRVIAHGDSLVALKLALIVLAAIFSLRREVRVEDKLFAIAAILQMFMYAGRPIIGAVRYVLVLYPAFLGWAAFAEQRWNRRQMAFYSSALGFLNLMWLVAFLNWSLVL
jgi:hypothetical protein